MKKTFNKLNEIISEDIRYFGDFLNKERKSEVMLLGGVVWDVVKMKYIELLQNKDSDYIQSFLSVLRRISEVKDYKISNPIYSKEMYETALIALLKEIEHPKNIYMDDIDNIYINKEELEKLKKMFLFITPLEFFALDSIQDSTMMAIEEGQLSEYQKRKSIKQDFEEKRFQMSHLIMVEKKELFDLIIIEALKKYAKNYSVSNKNKSLEEKKTILIKSLRDYFKEGKIIQNDAFKEYCDKLTPEKKTLIKYMLRADGWYLSNHIVLVRELFDSRNFKFILSQVS